MALGTDDRGRALRQRSGWANDPALRQRSGWANDPALKQRSGWANNPALKQRSGWANNPALKQRSGRAKQTCQVHRGDLGDLRPRQRRGAGRGAVACADSFPTWRGQNEQTMAHAAIAYAKTHRRRRAMAVTTLDRAGLDQPGDGGGTGACQPAAGAAHTRRRLRQPRPRPGAAADRGFRRRHGERQRRADAR